MMFLSDKALHAANKDNNPFITLAININRIPEGKEKISAIISVNLKSFLTLKTKEGIHHTAIPAKKASLGLAIEYIKSVIIAVIGAIIHQGV